MKRGIFFLLLALALVLCGCGAELVPVESAPPASPSQPETPSPEPSLSPPVEPSPVPEVVPSTEPMLPPSPEVPVDPELHYRTHTTLTYIRRTTLDPQGYYLSVYLEVPVFEEDGEGYRKINEFFEDLTQWFFSPENGHLASAWDYTIEGYFMATKEHPFFYERPATVTAHTDKLVSVTIDYQWMMWGVLDCGSDSYTFRTDTGELVKLTDLVDGTEEELREMIYAALEMRNEEYGGNEIEVELLQDHALDDFEFCVVGDKIHIRFDRYEAAYGAYGNFDIELPATLNPKF